MQGAANFKGSGHAKRQVQSALQLTPPFPDERGILREHKCSLLCGANRIDRTQGERSPPSLILAAT
jgi:hypothetical protein